MSRIVPFLAATMFAATAAAAPFTEGNLVAFSADASTNNTSFSIVEVSTSGALVQTISIDGSVNPATALRTSGTATSTGYLALNGDRDVLVFTGHNTTTTGVNVNTIQTKAVATLDADGNFNFVTTYTGTGTNQTRSATTLDGSNYFIGDQGGQYTNLAVAPSPVGNLRGVKTFGGIVYAGRASGTIGTTILGNVTAVQGGTIDPINGLPNSANFQDFYLISSGENGAAFDVLYTMTATSNTVGTIEKFSFDFVNSIWVSNGTAATGQGGFGLVAEDEGDGAQLYFTTGLGALVANSIVGVEDTTGYNQALALGSFSTVYTAPAGTILKGLEFAPAAPIPEPGTVALLGVGLIGGVVGFRRRRATAKA